MYASVKLASNVDKIFSLPGDFFTFIVEIIKNFLFW